MITIGLSAHRVEAIPFLQDLMASHEVIVLEEPPQPSFPAILEGKFLISNYLRVTEPSFPIYSEKVYHLLQRYHQKGGLIIQVEPYLEKLSEIHCQIEEGLKPAEQAMQPEMKAVYDAENMAFGALLHYYQSADKTFEETTRAVMEFAASDAKRIKLRDQMRAEAITDLIRKNNWQEKAIYIEAGYIHFALRPALAARQEAHGHKVRQVFVLAKPCCHLSYKQWKRAVNFILPPGDLLTLHHMFRGRIDEKLGRLLAARSLIYVSLLTKEELLPTNACPTPHLEEEIKLKAFVDRLDYKTCEMIFSRVKNLPAEEAKKMLRLPAAQHFPP